jgi:hypothetical protein
MTFWKLNLFPSSGEGWQKTLNQLGSIERGDLNQNPIKSIGYYPTVNESIIRKMCLQIYLKNGSEMLVQY